jgi:hypothetical protein
MQLREKYTDIDRTLQALMMQVKESLPFAAEHFPNVSSPEQLFYDLKGLTLYRNDPPGVEFIQSMPTLFSDITHRSGIRYPVGAGDCDCFTVTALAILKANGYKTAIVLRGRSKSAPVHIYPAVWNGSKWVPFDLTNKYYGHERRYPYRQTLRV